MMTKRTYPKRPCRQCGKEFQPVREWGAFCHPGCRHKFHRILKFEAIQRYNEANPDDPIRGGD